MKTAACLLACLFFAAPAYASRILFYDVRPPEKLLDVQSLDGSRTVSPDEFKLLGPIDLLDFDVLYVDMSAKRKAVLAEQHDAISEALMAGLGVYLQGDLAAYAAAPVMVPPISSIHVAGFHVPMAAGWHAIIDQSGITQEDFGEPGAVDVRGFMGIPQGFDTIAEAFTEDGESYPIILAGQLGHGRLVMSTHRFLDNDDSGVERIDAAIIRWLAREPDASDHRRAALRLLGQIFPGDFSVPLF